MIFAITQVIILMAGSSVGESSQQTFIEDTKRQKEDLTQITSDLEEVMDSLDEIELEKNVEVSTSPDIGADINQVVAVENSEIESSIEVEPAELVAPASPTVDEKESADTKNKLTVLENSGPTHDTSIATTSSRNPYYSDPDFVKHDHTGIALADDSERWTCVQDTKSGLMWEVKDQDDEMRNSNNQYTWYNPTNKAKPGKPDGGRCKGGTDCDTHAYIQAMNERNYCGYNDWTLPTREQMQTLIDFSDENKQVKINKEYFPNAVPSWYWTSSGTESDDETAWYVLFRNGFVLSDLKERPKHIRLVRKSTQSNNDG